MTSNPIQSIGIFANPGKPEALDVILPVMHFLGTKGVDVVMEEDVARMMLKRGVPEAKSARAATRDDIARRVNLVITFGGDGTLLAAAHSTLPYETPILGVNLGKLGFLADINAGDTLDAMDRILRGKFKIEKRMTLAGAIPELGVQFPALNDIVIGKGGNARIIHIEAYIDGDFLATFLADGIILSTPTGSTAYSLATGGPIVMPSSDVIVISPISAHTLTARPIIIPGDSVITIQAEAEEGTVMVMPDGRVSEHHSRQLVMSVRKGDRHIRLVKDVGPNYFEMLRKKLSWAQDHRFPGESPLRRKDIATTNKDTLT
jgi:NAD+ kinase